MKKYRVMLEGRNFLIEMEGRMGKRGFYQTFFLESRSPEEAEELAVKKVRGNPDLRKAVQNSKADPPSIHLEEIEEFQEFPKDVLPETGRGWYSEDEEKDASNQATQGTARKLAAPDRLKFPPFFGQVAKRVFC